MTSALALRIPSWASAGLREGGFCRGREWASATRETALGVSLRPRPAGRSGWERTSATSCPAARIASSAVAANGGVPAKTTRKARGARLLRGLALALLQLRADAFLLELGEILDEDLALEMVHLVLDARGQEARGVEREARPVAVEGGHRDALGALDVVIDSRDREATLLVHGETLAASDLRVDEDAQIAAVLAHVDHDDLAVHVYLRRREADA